MELNLRGHTAFVAGSTSGLGLAIATALGAEGANVIVSGRREEMASDCARKLPSAIGVTLDMGDFGSIERALAAAAEAYGTVDIVILNSGGPPPGGASGLSEPLLRAGLETMLLGQIQLISSLLPGMRTRGWGRVLAIGSSGVQEPLADLVISNTVRAALAAYLKTLANEVAREGVTVNMVLPGRIDTERVAALDQRRAERDKIDVAEARKRSEEVIPARRYGTPAEFAAMACFLCSEPAGYVTGSQVRVDGGLARGF